MTIQPTSFRTPEFTKTGSVLRQLQGNLYALSQQERQIASGQLYERPSDAPLAVRRMITWERWISRSEKYEANIELATGRLSTAEGTLDELNEIIVRAREIALQQINASATDETRSNAAVEISAMIDETITLANRRFADRYLFAGTELTRAPFERVGDYVVYNGDDQPSRVEISAGMVFSDSVTGAQAFGGMSSEIRGVADLGPIVTDSTLLADLNGGRGVRLGEIEIRDGTGERMRIDLTGAKTVGDVVERINETGFATVTMNASNNGIALSRPGADLTIVDVSGGRVARDLGIATAGGGTTVVGADLDPIARVTTALSELRDGAGLDLSGLVITNGNLSATLDFSAAETLEDVINQINASGTSVVARLSGDGRSLMVQSNLAGAELRVEENGGTTAAELGLWVDVDQLQLAALNGGTGIFQADGADFRITTSDGTTIDIELAGASTLGEVVELLNDHPENDGKFIAESAGSPTRLRLTDTAGGPDELQVAAINGSYSASTLGLEGASTGGVLEGGDLRPGGTRLVSVFDGFALLHQGLATSDTTVLTRALEALENAETKVLETRAEIGGQVRRLEISARRTELERLEMSELVSLEGDTDLATAIVEFQQQQTVYQAALQTAAALIQPSLLEFLG